MSLKTFHIVFITAAILLAFGFAGWLFREYRADGGSGRDLIWALCSAAAGVGLIFYERYVLKKLKNESYL
jgi:hypothetical protein